jgi:hypothetical protein
MKFIDGHWFSEDQILFFVTNHEEGINECAGVRARVGEEFHNFVRKFEAFDDGFRPDNSIIGEIAAELSKKSIALHRYRREAIVMFRWRSLITWNQLLSAKDRERMFSECRVLVIRKHFMKYGLTEG